MKHILLLAAIIISFSFSSSAQDVSQKYSYHLTGTILDENLQPLSRVQVCLSATVYNRDYYITLAPVSLGCHETDEKGKYDISAFLAHRAYTISATINSIKKKNSFTGSDEARKVDYEPVSLNDKGKDLELNFAFPDRAEATVNSFYHVYVENLNASKKSQLEKLRPFLSSDLYSLLKAQEKRSGRSGKNNSLSNSQLTEDFFSCNGSQPPLKYFINTTSQNGNVYSSQLFFTYSKSFVYLPYSSSEKETVNYCSVDAKIIESNGKWVIDNFTLWNKSNLKNILKNQGDKNGSG